MLQYAVQPDFRGHVENCCPDFETSSQIQLHWNHKKVLCQYSMYNWVP